MKKFVFALILGVVALSYTFGEDKKQCIVIDGQRSHCEKFMEIFWDDDLRKTMPQYITAQDITEEGNVYTSYDLDGDKIKDNSAVLFAIVKLATNKDGTLDTWLGQMMVSKLRSGAKIVNVEFTKNGFVFVYMLNYKEHYFSTTIWTGPVN
jgi:hypothetical protein